MEEQLVQTTGYTKSIWVKEGHMPVEITGISEDKYWIIYNMAAGVAIINLN